MDAGLLKQRITIQEPVTTTDGYGGNTVTWIDFATVWAAVNPLSGKTAYYMKQINGEIDTEVIVRYMTGIKAGWRLVHLSRIYTIVELFDEKSAHLSIKLVCKLMENSASLGQIAAPQIMSPIDLSIDFPLLGTIEGTALATIDRDNGDTHVMSHWQVTTADDTNFLTPIIDSTGKTDLTELTIPAGKLELETIYIARVCYYGKACGVSPWSPVVTFTTETGV